MGVHIGNWLEGPRIYTFTSDHTASFHDFTPYLGTRGDSDDDGVGISANSLYLNGGDIHDRAGNLADLSFDTVAADPDQRVSTLD